MQSTLVPEGSTARIQTTCHKGQEQSKYVKQHHQDIDNKRISKLRGLIQFARLQQCDVWPSVLVLTCACSKVVDG